MAAYITVGAKTTHGGTVISGSSHTTHNGIPVARKGDKVICKKCKKVTTIIGGDASFIIDGAPIARGGDVTSCGAKLIASQQAFAESGFDVGNIAQAVALLFPKSEPESMLNNIDEGKSTAIQIKNMSLYKNEFIPLGVPKFGEPESEGLKHSKFIIEIDIKQGTYSKLTVSGDSILSGIINEQTGAFTAGQTVEIEWDGFINDIYDSKWFTDKNNRPSIKLQGINEFGGTDEHTYMIEMTFKDEKWTDIVIDRSKSRIDITIRVDIDSNIRVEGLSPNASTLAKIKSDPRYLSTTPTLNTQTRTNQQLRDLAIVGINKYWSRNHSSHTLIKPNVTISGKVYEVFAQAVITDQNALPTTKITFNTNNKWKRSNSIPGFRNVIYNVGYIEYDFGWDYDTKAYADSDFEATFAHEVGHSIVWKIRDWHESLTHEGSSTERQKTNNTYNYPASGELDLIKYSGVDNPPDFFDRVVANEEDVRGLLWVSRLKED